MVVKQKKINQITTGIGEWCSSSYNIAFGCSHNCIYCYAKKNAIRFGRATEETWGNIELNQKAINHFFKKRNGVIMYPTSHDITPEIVDTYIEVLLKMLKTGNQVLITTKPHLNCISKILTKTMDYKNQILFRFTITSINNDTLRKYEPNAPGFNERHLSLRLAYNYQFKTSVSIEPCLDIDPLPLILKVIPYISDTLWVGTLNYMKAECNTWENVQNIVNTLAELPECYFNKLRLKDTIINLYKRKGKELPTVLRGLG